METVTKIILSCVFLFKSTFVDWEPDFTITFLSITCVIFFGQFFVTLYYIYDILTNNKIKGSIEKRDIPTVIFLMFSFFFKTMFYGMLIYFTIFFIALQFTIWCGIVFIIYNVLYILSSLIGDDKGCSSFGLTRSIYEQYMKKLKTL